MSTVDEQDSVGTNRQPVVEQSPERGKKLEAVVATIVVVAGLFAVISAYAAFVTWCWRIVLGY